ncbi:hypothetical protein ABMA28_010435 [Loxostege sticticalis]|uniref:Uncharacterized protein n=1 Tax=Loxostege sticticalis TaxID=481309 RepID=A0ABD0S879_LOXSC
MICATQIIRILRAAMRQWLADVQSLKGNKNKTSSLLKVFKKTNLVNMRPHAVDNGKDHLKSDDLESNETKRNCFWKEKLSVYVTILEAYEIAKRLFQLLILYQCLQTFLNGVFNVYYTTDFLQADNLILQDDDLPFPYAAVLTVAWALKNIITFTTLSVEFENFYIAANDVLVYSLLQLTKNCSEHEYQMQKNVVRMSRLSHKGHVCNLFDLDAAMPRRLLSLIATYSIVVLQFKIFGNYVGAFETD